MRKGLMIIAILSVFGLMVGTVFAQTADDIQKFPSCKYCGMDRQQFAHSRMFVEYDDGSGIGTCSIHCMAVDFAVNIDKAPKVIQVGDFNTKKLIDAETAFWVIGGNKPGVMTKRAKWAFEKKQDADKFIQENGGTAGSFEDAMKATYEDMYADTKMIREKRAMKRKAQQGAGQEQAGHQGGHGHNQ